MGRDVLSTIYPHENSCESHNSVGKDKNVCCLLDGFDAGYLWHVGLEVAFDADLQGDHAAGAADARAVEADLHFAFGCHIDKLKVAAICLNGGADELEHLHDLLMDGR